MDATDAEKRRSVRQKFDKIQSNVAKYAENLFETEFGLDDVDDVTIHELRHIYTNYEQSLTSMTLEAGQSFGNSTTQEEVDKFEYTTNDETVYNYLQHYLDKLDEQREHYAGSSAGTVVYDPLNDSGDSGAGIGLETESDLPPVDVDVSGISIKPEHDGSVVEVENDFLSDRDDANVNLGDEFEPNEDDFSDSESDESEMLRAPAPDPLGVYLRFDA